MTDGAGGGSDRTGPPRGAGFSPALTLAPGTLAAPAKPRRRLVWSPLTWRILAVNLLAPGMLVGGLLYLDQYERSLLSSELNALRATAELIAAAVGEGATVVDTVLWDPAEDDRPPLADTHGPVPGSVDAVAGIRVIDAEGRAGPPPPSPSPPPSSAAVTVASLPADDVGERVDPRLSADEAAVTRGGTIANAPGTADEPSIPPAAAPVVEVRTRSEAPALSVRSVAALTPAVPAPAEADTPVRKPVRVPISAHRLEADNARQMMRRLAQQAKVRARLFAPDGLLLADSRLLVGPAGGSIQVIDLPPPGQTGGGLAWLRAVYDRVMLGRPDDPGLPLYNERPDQTAADYAEAASALAGEPAGAVRSYSDRGRLLSVAVPVQHYKRVVGALMVSRPTDSLESTLFHVRLTILQLFLGTALITGLLSVYLSGTIARPLARLAAAAEQVRTGHGRRVTIPQFKGRRDEIGELAVALNAMTNALWSRMDAIERFAADVAHEIKNPLTSLRSAVETVSRLNDPDRQKRLIAIIEDDVKRLDRLISDISDASRVDAELSRAEAEPLAIRRMLAVLGEVYAATAAPDAVRVTVAPSGEGGSAGSDEAGRGDGHGHDGHGHDGDALMVRGVEGRLVQVVRNLVANAVSFSPPGGAVVLAAVRRDGWIDLTVDDDGPGIPPGKEQAIFDRFYSERPEGETFGTHSGLGLSISKQIVEAHGGTITAENRLRDGRTVGARFVVRLPAAD